MAKFARGFTRYRFEQLVGGDWTPDPKDSRRRTNGRFWTYLVTASGDTPKQKGRRLRAVGDGKSKPFTARTWRDLAVSVGIYKVKGSTDAEV